MEFWCRSKISISGSYKHLYTHNIQNIFISFACFYIKHHCIGQKYILMDTNWIIQVCKNSSFLTSRCWDLVNRKWYQVLARVRIKLYFVQMYCSLRVQIMYLYNYCWWMSFLPKAPTGDCPVCSPAGGWAGRGRPEWDLLLGTRRPVRPVRTVTIRETRRERDQLQPDPGAERSRSQEMISTGMSAGPGGSQGKVSDVQECAGCHKKIHDKYVLKVSHQSYPGRCWQ